MQNLSYPAFPQPFLPIGKMRHAIAASALLVALFLSNIAAAQSPVGQWQTIDDETGKPRSLVSIEAKGSGFEGKVAEIYLRPNEKADPVCKKCEGGKKNAKIVGMTFLWGFQKDGDEWSGGHILDPANGKTYKSTIWLEGANVLKVRGYWGFFYRTQTWKRVK